MTDDGAGLGARQLAGVASPSVAARSVHRGEAVWTALALVAAVACVFRGALGLFFSQDDFRDLGIAAGVLPPHDAPWRWISVHVLTDVLYPLFGNAAAPYHLFALGLHAVNAVLLAGLLARRVSRPAALVGAVFFASHPALFTALYWISARGDILATTFALIAVALALSDGRRRWLAAPAFVLSLLCKESWLLLPPAIALLRAWRPSLAGAPRRGPIVDPVLVLLHGIAVVAVVGLLRPGGAGVGIGAASGEPYAVDFGTPLLRNLLTYVGWAVDLVRWSPGLRYVDAPDPALFPLAVATLAIAAVLAGRRSWRERGGLVGAAAFLLLLIPVLPLRNHAYHYYLYGPLAAAALSVAAIADGVSTRRRWEWAGLCAVLLVGNGSRVVGAIESRPSPVFPGLWADPVVDRSRIAERVVRGLERAELPDGARLLLMSRVRAARLARIDAGSGETPPLEAEAYPERNVRAALLDGIGVRVLLPRVASATFVSAFAPDTGGTVRYALYGIDGDVEVHTRASLDSLRRSAWVDRW